MICHQKWLFETSERYYTIFLQQDLFGTWILTTAWGGKQSHIHGSKDHIFANALEIDAELARIFAKRLKRGYKLKTAPN